MTSLSSWPRLNAPDHSLSHRMMYGRMYENTAPMDAGRIPATIVKKSFQRSLLSSSRLRKGTCWIA
jgi:hypothetical protein